MNNKYLLRREVRDDKSRIPKSSELEKLSRTLTHYSVPHIIVRDNPKKDRKGKSDMAVREVGNLVWDKEILERDGFYLRLPSDEFFTFFFDFHGAYKGQIDYRTGKFYQTQNESAQNSIRPVLLKTKYSLKSY